MLTSVADKARLVEKLWTSRRLEAASLQDSLPHNVRVAETEGRPPSPPPPNHPPVNPYLQTNTLPQSEKYSCKNSYTKFKGKYSSSQFTPIFNHRPSPLLPRPLARYLLSVNLDSLHWMAHLDSSHHPGLFYEYGENLDISWPLTFSCIDSLQCGVSSFLGPWLLFRGYYLIYRVIDMANFFALAFEGNHENQPKEGLVWLLYANISRTNVSPHYFRAKILGHSMAMNGGPVISTLESE